MRPNVSNEVLLLVRDVPPRLRSLRGRMAVLREDRPWRALHWPSVDFSTMMHYVLGGFLGPLSFEPFVFINCLLVVLLVP
eukprot:4903728-Pyramimonas_sp.AAC.1